MEVFILDTETTGHKGVPIWNESNRLIQLVAYHPKSDEWFNRYINHGDDFYIPPNSGKIHNITMTDLKNNGLPLEDVLKDWVDWMKKHTLDKVPLIVAHNAAFDRNVLRKAFRHSKFNASLGKGGSRWSWKWFDSLLAFRVLYPELSDLYEPKDKPYSLVTLCNHFLNITSSKFHNAEVDVKMLYKLYIEFLLPKLGNIDESEFILPVEPILPASNFNVSFLPVTRHPCYYDGNSQTDFKL
jgi:DNA polymerase III epsilon subunit-like protein